MLKICTNCFKFLCIPQFKPFLYNMLLQMNNSYTDFLGLPKSILPNLSHMWKLHSSKGLYQVLLSRVEFS